MAKKTKQKYRSRCILRAAVIKYARPEVRGGYIPSMLIRFRFARSYIARSRAAVRSRRIAVRAGIS